MFPGSTKKFEQYVGTSFLREVHAATTNQPIPAFAIGGINASNVRDVLAAGFHRVAVTGAVRDADDPAAAAKALKQQLAAGSVERGAGSV